MKLNSFSSDERYYVSKHFAVYSKISRVFVLVCFILICIFSLLPSSDIPSTNIFPLGDKGAHALAYAGFGMFIFLSISFSMLAKLLPNQEIKKLRVSFFSMVQVLIIGLPLGIILEIIQSQVGRSFDLVDWLADSIGLAVGCIIAAIINQMIVNYEAKKIR